MALLSACEYDGAQSLPLPGGTGQDGYRVTMVFDDVTNLVPKETCRAGDVVVGSVESVELAADLRATVVCRIDPDVRLPGNAVPTLRETSLLGERFVGLDPPPGEAPHGTLAPGSRLAEGAAHVAPDVEVVLGALSQVLNGGGLANVETISSELTAALRGSDLGGTADELERLVGTLDRHGDDLVAALDACDRLAAGLARQRDVIGSTLDAVPQGLAVLDRQRPRLVRLLDRLGSLSDVALPLIRETRADTVADLERLAPVLHDLAASRHRLARALEATVTFPFPSYTKYVTRGDYAGMFATMTLDIDSVNHLLAGEPDSAPASTTGDPDAPVPGLPSLPVPTPSLPSLPLPSLPSLPGGLLDQLPGAAGLSLAPRTERVRGRAPARPPRTLAELLTGGAR